MADIKEGIYVTELIGQGVNPVTGDYSRGASGFVIRDGAIAGPIAEFTIAGNLVDMFAALIPANDLEFRHATNVPTLRIDAANPGASVSMRAISRSAYASRSSVCGASA